MSDRAPLLLFTLTLALLLATPVLAATEHVELTIEPAAEGITRGGRLPIDVLARIAPGWHINSNKPKQKFLIPTELSFTLPPGIATDTVHYPPAEERMFAFSGTDKLLVYEGKLGLATMLMMPADFLGERVRIEAALRYQACNDSTCLPPKTAHAELIVPVVAAAASSQTFVGEPDDHTGGGKGDGTAFEGWLHERGLAFTLAAVALLGLGLNLTPCVYPLISVTIAYFGGQARSRGTQARLVLLYVLGIAVSFSLLGVVAALSGGLFGAALQKPAVMLFIAAVMVALALSSFGLYQLQPPAALMRLAGGSAQGALGALFMGLTMGIVAAPCVGPVVLGLLVFVGSRQDAALGFLLFFVLALGMGAPYVVLGMAAGSITRLPRSGEWLVWTERLFGCVLLALAAYFVAPLTPAPVRTYLLPATLALSGVYLGFIDRAGHALRCFPLLKRGVALVLVALAVWLALPHGPRPTIAWASVDTLPHNGDAHGVNRPVLVDFAAEWCIPCREMDHTTYVHAEVLREASRFHMVKADITEENEATTRIVDRYQVRGVPTIILFSREGDERERLVGYVGPDEMLEAMRAVR